MRIRTQNLLFIVPVFVGLAIPISLLGYREQVAENNWGMAEALEALTVGTAAFVDAPSCAQLVQTDGAPQGEALDRLRLPLERLTLMDPQKERMSRRQLEQDPAWVWVWTHLPWTAGRERTVDVWERTRRLTVLAPDGQRVLVDLSLSADADLAEPSLAQLADAVERGQVSLYYRTRGDEVVSLEREQVRDASSMVEVMRVHNALYAGPFHDATGRAVAVGWSPVVDASGELAGLLRAEMDASPLEVQRRLAQLKAVVISGGIILCGVLAALFTSRVVTGGIHQLTGAARAAVAGDYGRRLELHTIQEMADLGHTFDTMTSVLQEIVSRTRRELIDGEQFRTQADLAVTYRGLFSPPLQEQHAGVSVATRLAAGRPTGDFCGTLVAAGRAHVVLGRVRAQADLAAVTLASAAHSLLRSQLAVSEPGRALAEVCDLFDVETCLCVCWREGDAAVQWWAHGSAAGGPVTEGSTPLVAGESVIFQTLTAADGAAACSYAELFRHLPPAQLTEELMAVIGDVPHGAVAALGRQSG